MPQAVGDFLIPDAVRESNGFACAVSDAAILEAGEDAARLDGVLFCAEGGAARGAEGGPGGGPGGGPAGAGG